MGVKRNIHVACELTLSSGCSLVGTAKAMKFVYFLTWLDYQRACFSCLPEVDDECIA